MNRRETAGALLAVALVVVGAVKTLDVHRARLACEAMDAQPNVTANCGGLLHDLSFWGSLLVALAGVALAAAVVHARRRDDRPAEP